MSSTTTPEMDLTIPAPVSELGPDYAIEINQNFQKIDAHDHRGDGTSGVQLGADSLNVDADLQMNSHNLGTIRALRLDTQSAVLAAPGDTRELYSVNGDLYYNNASGTAVRITSGSGVNVTSGTTTLASLAITSDHVILPADTYTVYQCNSAGGVINVTLPTSAGVGAGRWIIVIDAHGSAATHNITITASGSDSINLGNPATIVDVFSGYILIPDGVSGWQGSIIHGSTLTLTRLNATNVVASTVSAATVTTSTLNGGGSPISTSTGGNGFVSDGPLTGTLLKTTGTVAATGSVRVTSTGSVVARNNANSADIPLVALSFGGGDVVTVGDGVHNAFAIMSSTSQTAVNCAGNGGLTCTPTAVTVQGNGNATIKLTGNSMGFYGGTGITKPTVSGAKGGNAALASLLTALAALGLLTDSST